MTEKAKPQREVAPPKSKLKTVLIHQIDRKLHERFSRVVAGEGLKMTPVLRLFFEAYVKGGVTYRMLKEACGK